MATYSQTKPTMHLLNNPVINFMQLTFDHDCTKEINGYNSLEVLKDTKTITSGLYFVSCKIDAALQTVKVVK